MRVLVSTGILPNRADPTRGVYVFAQVTSLARGNDVRAIAPVPYIPGFLRGRGYKRYEGIPRHDTIDGLEISYPRYVVVPKIMRFLHGLFLYLCVLPAFRREIRARRPDVLLGFFAYPYGVATVLLAKTFGLPVIVSCRGSDINILARPFLRRRVISWALRACDRVIAVSEALAHEIERLHVPRSRLRVVPNGIDTTRFCVRDRAASRSTLGLDPDKRFVVCVSRLSHEKGIDVLLDAIGRTQDTTLLLVGDGAARANLEARSATLDIEDRVRFLGRRPHEEVPVWLGAADISVLASRSEGHPNAVIEALACGRAVVATDVGGVREILTTPALGVVVPSEDPAALADGIVRALDTTWDEDVLVASVTRHWGDVARDLEKVIEEARAAHGHTARRDTKVGNL